MPEPEQHLADGLQFGEFAKDEQNALLNAPIWILLDTGIIRLHVSDGNGEMKVAAPRLLAHGLDGSLPKHG
ncbi:hypothetical protein LPB79_31095 (plasmid) [Rhizobium sp. T136]|nr:MULTISPECIES: hypothetical protein [Rhizobium]MCS0463710.1 hypothetical protein [Rhizobium favelukesii]UFS85121.1 hypothetical protein LPB79_31095 [Rhizobium sp. T136]